MLRRHTAEHGMRLRRTAKVRVFRHAGHIQIMLRALHARPARNFRHGYRVIAGDDLYIHALCLEIGQCCRCIRTDFIRKHHKAQRLRIVLQRTALQHAVSARQHQHAPSCRQLRLYRTPEGGIPAAQHDLRCAEDVFVSVFQHQSTPPALGAEGDGGFGLPAAAQSAEACPQSLRRGVVLARGGGKAAQQLCQCAALHARYGDGFQHFHAALGDGACFVQTQRVHPGQILDAGKLVNQRFAARQADDAHGQRYAHQKVKPLGDHADDGGHGGTHGVLQPCVKKEILLCKHDDEYGDDGNADETQQPVQCAHHLRAVTFAAPGLAGDARGITVGADLIQPCRARAGHHKTAREQRVPGAFLHKLCLACQQRFVYLQRPVRNNGVRAHLAARAQQHNVVQYQLVCGDGARSAAADHTSRAAREQCHLVQRAFDAQLLHNVDEHIGGHNAQKHHVAVCANSEQAGGQRHEHKIEKGKYVVPHDLPFCFGEAVLRGVVPSGGPALGRLFLCKPCFRCGVKPLHRAAFRAFAVLLHGRMLPFSARRAALYLEREKCPLLIITRQKRPMLQARI